MFCGIDKVMWCGVCEAFRVYCAFCVVFSVHVSSVGFRVHSVYVSVALQVYSVQCQLGSGPVLFNVTRT